jgi:hypothetical protein
MKKPIKTPIRFIIAPILALACIIGLVPKTEAVTPPPPGNYGSNTAAGQSALLFLTTGAHNTAIGSTALIDNTAGSFNTSIGSASLPSNKTGSQNTAAGSFTMIFNQTGDKNTAIGFNALRDNASGSNNTAVGHNALEKNIGSHNVGLGDNAGSHLTGGVGNVCIGSGVVGEPGETNTTRIKNVYFPVAFERAVYVNADNKIGTLSSSRRYKEEIKPMDKASEMLFALKPVTFRYKKEVDPARMPSFGLIAEEVAKISPDLITRDDEGNPQTVRYDAVNAMLLNEFLKEHRKVEQLTKDFQSKLAEQQKQINALTAGLQKVSDKVELSKPAPQVVNNNQ